jgi:serine/threonine protein kinase
MVLSLPLSERPGDRIGRYKLLEELGKGGFGVVYVAQQDEPVRRRVALKIIKLGMDTEEVIARLFHVMTLFRQNRAEEARMIFLQAEAHMPPLPKDESKPAVDGRGLSGDVLTWWLAYKEAKSLLNEPAAAKP